MKWVTHITFSVIISTFICCSSDNDGELTPNCPSFGFEIVLSSPYSDPIWHPSGDIIGFNYLPLDSINYKFGYDCPLQAEYKFRNQSAGFYLIDSNGKNQRRALSYFVYDPAWSPDGKWLAFSDQNGTIFKIAFDGNEFDETSLCQLTQGGRFWDVAWSYDGQHIAYNNRIAVNDTFGIWVSLSSQLSQSQYFSYGGKSSWSNSSNTIYYAKDNSYWSKAWTEGMEKKIFDYSNYNFQSIDHPSLSGESILFDGFVVSDDKTGRGLWLLDLKRPALNEIKSDAFSGSWGPTDKIVYVNFNFQRIDTIQGTIWIMDRDGSNAQQLTYHKNLEIIMH